MKLVEATALDMTVNVSVQRHVVFDSPRLVDFAIGLVILVLNLPNRQVLFFRQIQITEGLESILLIKKGFTAS